MDRLALGAGSALAGPEGATDLAFQARNEGLGAQRSPDGFGLAKSLR